MPFVRHGRKTHFFGWWVFTVDAALFAFAGLPANVFQVVAVIAMAMVGGREITAKMKGAKDGNP